MKAFGYETVHLYLMTSFDLWKYHTRFVYFICDACQIFSKPEDMEQFCVESTSRTNNAVGLRLTQFSLDFTQIIMANWVSICPRFCWRRLVTLTCLIHFSLPIENALTCYLVVDSPVLQNDRLSFPCSSDYLHLMMNHSIRVRHSTTILSDFRFFIFPCHKDDIFDSYEVITCFFVHFNKR